MEKKEPKFIRGKYTPAAKEATKRYQAKAYDEIKIRVSKGEKEILKSVAEKYKSSLNNFITTAVYIYIDCLERASAEMEQNADVSQELNLQNEAEKILEEYAKNGELPF